MVKYSKIPIGKGTQIKVFMVKYVAGRHYILKLNDTIRMRNLLGEVQIDFFRCLILSQILETQGIFLKVFK